MNVRAKDIMRKQLKTVPLDLPLADLQCRFIDDEVSGYPVVDGEKIHGVVSVTDLWVQLSEQHGGRPTASAKTDKHLASLHVRDIMSTDIVSVSPAASLQDVAALMGEKRVHRVLVVDECRLVGLISSLDVVRACGQESIDISFTGPNIQDF